MSASLAQLCLRLSRQRSRIIFCLHRFHAALHLRMIESIDDYYNQVMEHGTGPAKILMTEEALMSSTLSKKLANMSDDLAEGAKQAQLQRELMCLLHAHRGMVIANFLMERAEGHELGQGESPIVVPDKKLLMEG